jgi:hypothetical protein
MTGVIMTGIDVATIPGEELQWSISEAKPGEIDPETREQIRPGWYVCANLDGDPEDVRIVLYVEFAVDGEGVLAGERVARHLVDLLNSDTRQVVTR